jgi:tRNA pseudouridine55 synthase
MDGIINLDKPKGPTSHDVVRSIRKCGFSTKVGHTGTLDPNATGVLLICLGRATKISRYLLRVEKEYLCKTRLGLVTDTLDVWGNVLEKRVVQGVTPKKIEEILASFRGVSFQTPPAFSATKYKGKPLYKWKREGRQRHVPPKRREIYNIEFLEYKEGVDSAEVTFRVTCSSGTYIRRICSDLGERLGCGGALSVLIRERIGDFKRVDAIGFNDLLTLDHSRVEKLITTPLEALNFLPFFEVRGLEWDVLHGMPINIPPALNRPLCDTEMDGLIRLGDGSGMLLAIGKRRGDKIFPIRVFYNYGDYLESKRKGNL